MKILNAQQIREADKYTIASEPIASIDLMERASLACLNWISDKYNNSNTIAVFCGIGNNGGDGLAIARLLTEQNYSITCYIVQFSENESDDFKTNLTRLKQTNCNLHIIRSESDFPDLKKNSHVIDAIFGTGLARPVSGFTAKLIKKINSFEGKVISIDIPSGLFCEDNSQNSQDTIIKANHTLSFEVGKLAFVSPENQNFSGEWHILPIGLNKSYIESLDTQYILITKDYIKEQIVPRDKFSHKGTFGHAMIIAGSEGKMGAAVLATSACLRSGVGLATAYIPQCGIDILQTAVPEAMVIENIGIDCLQGNYHQENDFTLAIGPGIGMNEATQSFVKSVFEKTSSPIVIDADALNIIAKNKDLSALIPKGSILTPHPKEFKRLVGDFDSDIEKLEKLKAFSKETSCYIVLKGANTAISCPEGNVYFNTTGNPGMATGGSGDVLTGIISGLLAQGYSSKNAAIIGVFLHGLAGDIARKDISEEALIASDITSYLGKTFLQLENNL